MFNGLMTLITKISFTEDRDSVDNYGIGQLPTSYGNKNFIYGGSLEIQLDQLNEIQMSAPFGKILMIPPFTIKMILGISPDSGQPDGSASANYKLNNCRFTKNEFNAKQNDSSIFVNLPFKFAGLVQG
jgi:hypothetical protein